MLLHLELFAPVEKRPLNGLKIFWKVYRPVLLHFENVGNDSCAMKAQY
jgi:hypothetical protein